MKKHVLKILDGYFLIPFILLMLPFLHTGNTLDPNVHLQYIVLATGLLSFWSFLLFKQQHLVLKNKSISLFLAVFGGYILYSFISAGISINRPDAFFIISKYALLYILVIACVLWGKDRDLFGATAKSAAILGFICVLSAYYDLFKLIAVNELLIPQSTYSIKSVFAHRNLLSEILVLTLPFSVYLILSGKKVWRLLAISSYFLVLLMVVVLSNRASWLAIGIGFMLITVGLASKKIIVGEKYTLYLLAVTFTSLAGGLILLFIFSDTATLKEHSLNAIDFNQGSAKDRIELWTRTIKCIEENPVTGSGLESWKIEVLKYGNEGLVSENNTTFYQRPHNDFIWVAAEQGIIGLLLYILLFLVVIVGLVREIMADSKENAARALVVLMVSSSFLVFSFFSFPRERIVHNVVLFTAWGSIMNQLNYKVKKVKAIRIQKIAGLFVLCLLFIIVIGTYRIMGEVHTKKALAAKSESRYKDCIHEINKAYSVFYQMDATSTPLKWYEARAYYMLKDYISARRHFEEALSLNPFHIYVLNDYAGCLVRSGEEVKAVEKYEQAIRIAPNFQDAKLNLCALYFNSNQLSGAFELLKTMDRYQESERYKKILEVVLREIIIRQIEAGKVTNDQIEQFKKESGNYSYYKNLMLKSVKYNLRAEQFFTFVP